MSNFDPTGSPTSSALKALGFWFKDTLSEIVNEISAAVLDDMSENSLIDSNQSYKMLGLSEFEVNTVDINKLQNSPSDTGSTNSGHYEEEFDKVSSDVLENSTIRTTSSTPIHQPIISRISDIYSRRFSREDAIFKRIIYKLTTNDPSSATSNDYMEEEDDAILVESLDTSVLVTNDWSGLY